MNIDNGNTENAVSGSLTKQFGKLYEEYLPKVFQYVNYRVGDRTSAEDLTSDIFNKALTGFTKFDSRKAAFSTWIFSIARNTVIDYYRTRSREQKQRKQTQQELPASSISPEDEVSHLEEIRKLHESLSSLNLNERELIALKFSGEITNREISKITGLSESNVGTILCRAVRKLRDEFKGWQNGG